MDYSVHYCFLYTLRREQSFMSKCKPDYIHCVTLNPSLVSEWIYSFIKTGGANQREEGPLREYIPLCGKLDAEPKIITSSF